MRPSLRMVAVGAIVATFGAVAGTASAHPNANLVAARADAAQLLTRQAMPLGVTVASSDPSDRQWLTREVATSRGG